MSAGVRSHNKGMEDIDDLSTVKTLTVPDGAIYALIQARAQDVWWSNDGATPSTSHGLVLKVDQVLEYDAELEDLKFIQASAGAKLRVSYFGI